MTYTPSQGLGATTESSSGAAHAVAGLRIRPILTRHYFPTIIYSACYDVFMNREKIIDAQMGVAICTPIVSIPPRNVLVAFEKPFEDRKRGIAFKRGCCWGMRTITELEFLEGTNRAREIRGWKGVRDPFGSFFGPGRGGRKEG